MKENANESGKSNNVGIRIKKLKIENHRGSVAGV